jgi:hypothetical protein
VSGRVTVRSERLHKPLSERVSARWTRLNGVRVPINTPVRLPVRRSVMVYRPKEFGPGWVDERWVREVELIELSQVARVFTEFDKTFTIHNVSKILSDGGSDPSRR